MLKSNYSGLFCLTDIWRVTYAAERSMVRVCVPFSLCLRSTVSRMCHSCSNAAHLTASISLETIMRHFQKYYMEQTSENVQTLHLNLCTVKPVFEGQSDQGTPSDQETLPQNAVIFPMVRHLWWRDSCHIGILSGILRCPLKTGFTVYVYVENVLMHNMILKMILKDIKIACL